jgi:hypothetical protein
MQTLLGPPASPLTDQGFSTNMPPFKDPGFQERATLARDAKQKALEKLRAKPPIDEAVLAERRAAQEAREQAEAEKRRLKREAEEQAKAERRAKAEEEAAKAPPPVVPKTEAEKKAERDARYAARKARKS